MGLPQTQRAAVKEGTGDDSTAPVKDIPVPEPGPGQILVKINWSGLCTLIPSPPSLPDLPPRQPPFQTVMLIPDSVGASDKSLLHDEWAPMGFTMTERSNNIAGHEGAGTVAAVPPSASHLWSVGDRAGIKWVVSTCGICEFCTNGTDELQCAKQVNSGYTIPGTFQQYAVTDARYCTRIPDGVKDEEAGPIMCGGVTAYVACKRSAVRPGQWLVLPGAGGGLGHVSVFSFPPILS
jgi:alcohol dehydrogenase, propanol-preferring